MTYYVKIRDLDTGGVICTDAFDADTHEELDARLTEFAKDYPGAWVDVSDHPFQ